VTKLAKICWKSMWRECRNNRKRNYLEAFPQPLRNQ